MQAPRSPSCQRITEARPQAWGFPGQSLWWWWWWGGGGRRRRRTWGGRWWDHSPWSSMNLTCYAEIFYVLQQELFTLGCATFAFFNQPNDTLKSLKIRTDMIPIMHCICAKLGRVALLLHLFCAASKQIQIIQNNSTKSTRVTYLCTLELFDVWFDWHWFCSGAVQLICNQKNYIAHCNLMTHSKYPKIVNIQKKVVQFRKIVTGCTVECNVVLPI